MPYLRDQKRKLLFSFVFDFVEMAREQRNRRKRRQKWILVSVGLAAALGSAAVAWSYLPSTISVLTEQKNSSSTACTNQN
jgi:hypothetical protein